MYRFRQYGIEKSESGPNRIMGNRPSHVEITVNQKLNHPFHILPTYQGNAYDASGITPGSPSNCLSESAHANTSTHHPRCCRQLTVDIGEEWETAKDRGIASPSSPKSQPQTDFSVNLSSGKKDGIQIITDPVDSLRSNKAIDQMQLFFYHLENGEQDVPKPHASHPNPYNDINHKFHSALHCPCYLFAFYMCCVPAVLFMEKSDKEYIRGNEKLALIYGERSTKLFFVGAILGLLLLILIAYMGVIMVMVYL